MGNTQNQGKVWKLSGKKNQVREDGVAVYTMAGDGVAGLVQRGMLWRGILWWRMGIWRGRGMWWGIMWRSIV